MTPAGRSAAGLARADAAGPPERPPPERPPPEQPPPEQPAGKAVTGRLLRLRVLRHRVPSHLGVLAGYLAVAIAVTWPRAAYLANGKLPATRDAGVYVWDFWWIAHQLEHLGNPWATHFLAAPAGAQLGYHALMPLAGVMMVPVTVLFGPSASYNLLSVIMPALLSYAMYRAARLWLPSQAGAIAAGGFFGLSADLTWHAWYQLNLAAGALFLPLALEAAVRLRRHPCPRHSLILGALLGASLLTDQQSAVLVVILVMLALLPWLLRRRAPGAPGWRVKLSTVAVTAGAALVVAGPQIAAMVAQTRAGGASFPAQSVDKYYVSSNAYLPGLFSVSPRTVRLGLTALKPASYTGPVGDGVPTFGLILSVLAVAGLAVSWRRRSAWLLALLWLASTVLALGAALKIGTHVYIPATEVRHGVRVSAVMPFTWFVRLPGLAGFREAARFVMLGLVPAALLGGAAVDWLRYHAAALVVPVLLVAVVEAGWAGNPNVPTMRTAVPKLDRPIAADHSSSIVVDVPFGIRGGVPLPREGPAFDPEAQVLATADGHPRAVAYLSRIPAPTLAAIRRNAFYAGLLSVEGQPRGVAERLTGTTSYRGLLAAAREAARHTDIGWVLVWHRTPGIIRYLTSTGFRFDYKAAGVGVYRPQSVRAG